MNRVIASYFVKPMKVELYEVDWGKSYYVKSTPEYLTYGYDETEDQDLAFDFFEQIVQIIHNERNGK